MNGTAYAACMAAGAGGDVDDEPWNERVPDDEDDPNRCPWCGGDVEVDPATGDYWCADIQCGWTMDDDVAE